MMPSVMPIAYLISQLCLKLPSSTRMSAFRNQGYTRHKFTFSKLNKIWKQGKFLIFSLHINKTVYKAAFFT